GVDLRGFAESCATNLGTFVAFQSRNWLFCRIPCDESWPIRRIRRTRPGNQAVCRISCDECPRAALYSGAVVCVVDERELSRANVSFAVGSYGDVRKRRRHG